MLFIVHVRSGLDDRCSIRNLVVISNYPSVRHKFLWLQLGDGPDISVRDNGLRDIGQ